MLPRTLAIGAAARWTLGAGFLTALACCIILKMAYGHSAIGFANPARSIGRFIGGQWARAAQPPAELPRALANVSDPDLAFVVHRMIGNAGPGGPTLDGKYQRIIEITAQLRKAIRPSQSRLQ